MAPEGAAIDTTVIIRAAHEMLPYMRIAIEQGIAKGMQAVPEMQERAVGAAAARGPPL